MIDTLSLDPSRSYSAATSGLEKVVAVSNIPYFLDVTETPSGFNFDPSTGLLVVGSLEDGVITAFGGAYVLGSNINPGVQAAEIIFTTPEQSLNLIEYSGTDTSTFEGVTITDTPIPEPSSLLLLGTGLLGVVRTVKLRKA